jgi:hypothetical protein
MLLLLVPRLLNDNRISFIEPGAFQIPVCSNGQLVLDMKRNQLSQFLLCVCVVSSVGLTMRVDPHTASLASGTFAGLRCTSL